MNDDRRQPEVLVVDDDRFLLELYEAKFKEEGIEIKVAENGEEAFDLFDKGFRPLVALIDVLMPKLSGLDLIRKLRQSGYDKDLSVIILSNLGQEGDVRDGLELGIAGYIVKASTTPSEVVNKTAVILNKKHNQ